MDIIYEFSKLGVGGKVQFLFIVVAFVFMVFSCLGWVLELFFRRFVSQKKWVNPGFLKGPYLPIYGTGVVMLTAYIFLMRVWEDLFPNPILFDIVIVLGIGVVMTVIELIGGLIFIKGMNIRLWDYSNRKFNYKGIICLEFSLIWTALGAVFYFFLFDPIVNMIIKFLTLDWIMIAIFLMGMFYGVLLLDLINSLQIAGKIKQFAKENQIVLKIEELKIHIQEKVDKKEFKFLSPFKSSGSLAEHLKSFIAEQKGKLERKGTKERSEERDTDEEKNP